MKNHNNSEKVMNKTISELKVKDQIINEIKKTNQQYKLKLKELQNVEKQVKDQNKNYDRDSKKSKSY